MKNIAYPLRILSAVWLLAVSAVFSAASANDKLISQWGDFNSACRGSLNEAACRDRDSISQQLESIGYCVKMGNWSKCDSQQSAQTATQSNISPPKSSQGSDSNSTNWGWLLFVSGGVAVVAVCLWFNSVTQCPQCRTYNSYSNAKASTELSSHVESRTRMQKVEKLGPDRQLISTTEVPVVETFTVKLIQLDMLCSKCGHEWSVNRKTEHR